MRSQQCHQHATLPAQLPSDLALPHRRPGGGIACTHRVVRPQEAGVVARVRTRDRYKRARRAVSAAVDLDLGARDVQLRAADVLRLVQGDALDADEVLPARRAGGQLEVDGLFLCTWESAPKTGFEEFRNRRHALYAGHVDTSLVKGPAAGALMLPTLNHTLPAASQVLRLALSGALAM
jgi:hypothetical protein